MWEKEQEHRPRPFRKVSANSKRKCKGSDSWLQAGRAGQSTGSPTSVTEWLRDRLPVGPQRRLAEGDQSFVQV